MLSIVLAVLIPAAVAGALALVGNKASTTMSATVRSSIAPLSCAAGVLAGYLVIRGWPGWPLPDATSVTAYVAIVSGAVAIGQNTSIPSNATARKYASLVLVLIAFSPFLWRMTRSPRTYAWTVQESALSIAGMSAGVAFMWCSVQELYKRATGAGPEVALTAIAAAGWIVLHQSGSALLGQLSGVLAAATAGLAVTVSTGGARHPNLRSATSAVFAMVFATLVINGHLLAELSRTAGLLLISCPAAFVVMGWARRVTR